MFSWTQGYDSTGSPPLPDSTHIGPFNDPSQDMVHLDLQFDSVADNFRMNVTRVIADFKNPVDAEIDSNTIYLVENGDLYFGCNSKITRNKLVRYRRGVGRAFHSKSSRQRTKNANASFRAFHCNP